MEAEFEQKKKQLVERANYYEQESRKYKGTSQLYCRLVRSNLRNAQIQGQRNHYQRRLQTMSNTDALLIYSSVIRPLTHPSPRAWRQAFPMHPGTPPSQRISASAATVALSRSLRVGESGLLRPRSGCGPSRFWAQRCSCSWGLRFRSGLASGPSRTWSGRGESGTAAPRRQRPPHRLQPWAASAGSSSSLEFR